MGPTLKQSLSVVSRNPVHGPSAFPAWARSASTTLDHHSVQEDKGLSSAEVNTRRKYYGFNELHKEDHDPWWKLILEQFEDTLVRILLLAAVVSFALAYFEDNPHAEEKTITAYIEPLVILLILVINAIVGVWQESNAERALEALKEMQSEHAKVLRDGRLVPDLPARELVPGDVVEIRVGDKVPADMRLLRLKTSTLRVEQASLTGESVAVLKSTREAADDEIELQGKECMVFAGTTVVNGSAICIVNSIGMQTEIGHIQEQIQAAAEEEEDTPLKQKLDQFGQTLTKVIAVICILVWVINYKYFVSWEFKDGRPVNITFSFAKATYYFKIAVALAVAAIPEGLPAVITTCLALGTRKMAQKNAIVRKLPSVETLGCTTVICSDKTGTLTTNQMSVVHLVATGTQPSELREFDVTGSTYEPRGGVVQGLPRVLDLNLQMIAEICALNNEGSIVPAGNGFKAVGLPTEAALKVLVEKIGAPDSGVSAQVAASSSPLAFSDWWCGRYEKRATLEFDRMRKSMSVLVNAGQGSSNRLLVKGAVENLLDRSTYIQLSDGSVAPLTHQVREAILQKLTKMTTRALRCLALAYTDELGPLAGYDGTEAHPAHKVLLSLDGYANIESNLVFAGMVGLQDPPRPEVKGAIQQCRDAGIRVIVITGDNKDTAEAVCKKIGVFHEGESLHGKSFTGREFVDLSYEKRRAVLMDGKLGGRCISRAEPRHKQDIVRMLKEAGEVVAMTGDGVNDAPALKLADIGVAMGIAGTEVAKEASDMVLADDNFSTIVAAVEEGRSIYSNMKAFIRYMISSNIGEVASIFFTAALGLPEILIPVQLLWVNLVTDGPPATALGFNPPDQGIMQKPPRNKDDVLINGWVFFRYMVIGVYVGVATVGIFALWYTEASFLGIDLSQDGHTLVSLHQLMNWDQCSSWEGFKAAPFTAGARTITFDNPCDYFTVGKVKATTLSLTVLVAIEMLNSFNALSEDGSLVRMPPWVNPWLCIAASGSMFLHFVILYVPVLATIFSIVPLSFNEWLLVLVVSFPVILIDEVLKFVGRRMADADRAARKKME